ncbi:Uma2 family endonuclease [Streptomyces sp. G44]|uniref:Uma2 family endonuclease n=1 Tax=Streptomyces sp. G44 TaxID=2807632 RepID=UPI001EF8559B|nr:Uma2 family endonuclease [Streptomyces sp. G44]
MPRHSRRWRRTTAIRCGRTSRTARSRCARCFRPSRVERSSPRSGRRAADVLVMEREVYERGVHDDFAASAPDVSVAFEVVSPPGASEDHLTKLRDYARMGIPMQVR